MVDLVKQAVKWSVPIDNPSGAATGVHVLNMLHCAPSVAGTSRSNVVQLHHGTGWEWHPERYSIISVSRPHTRALHRTRRLRASVSRIVSAGS